MEEGVNWFGGPFRFDGWERWQLWFDNPNKAAVLLVELAIVGLVLMFADRRRYKSIGAVLFLLPSLALVRTFSRGGIVAWLAAVVFVLWREARASAWRRTAAAVVGMTLLVVAVSSCFGLSRRMANGFSGEDPSVSNRLEVWSRVPRMMCDAPLGWGIGGSGAAYMGWYQPLERSERYRTLVNSHLTWFVETGWCGMAFWISAWISVLCLGLRVGQRTRRWTCLAEWIGFGVAGAFSSVMESPWLWAVPMLSASYEVFALGRGRWRVLGRSVSLGAFSGLVVTIGAFVASKALCGASGVSKTAGYVEYRGEDRECWVVADAAVLGGRDYPRVLRESAPGRRCATFRFVDKASDLPAGAETVVFCGGAESDGRRGTRMTVWLSPSRDAEVAEGDPVIVGEFSSASGRWTGTAVVEVSGAGDYIPTWPVEISAVITRGRVGKREKGGRRAD